MAAAAVGGASSSTQILCGSRTRRTTPEPTRAFPVLRHAPPDIQVMFLHRTTANRKARWLVQVCHAHEEELDPYSNSTMEFECRGCKQDALITTAYVENVMSIAVEHQHVPL
jgi:hypothetical protein